MGAIRPVNVKVIIWSATTRAAPISFFMPTVCRIIFLMFLPNYCEGEFESRSPGGSLRCFHLAIVLRKLGGEVYRATVLTERVILT